MTAAHTSLPPAYRAATVCRLTDATYRQVDYWARTGLVTPTVNAGIGSGYQRLYSPGDLWHVAIVKHLIDSGLTLPVIRTVLPTMAEDGSVTHHGITLSINLSQVAADLDERINALELIGEPVYVKHPDRPGLHLVRP